MDSDGRDSVFGMGAGAQGADVALDVAAEARRQAVARGELSLSFDILLAATFGRTFRVSPDTISVASIEHGPFGRVTGWDELAYRALRARREWGGACGWKRWRTTAERRRVAEQARRMRTWTRGGPRGHCRVRRLRWSRCRW